MSNKTPPVLETYLSPDKDSQTILTGILGASTNWLVLRYLYSILHGSVSATGNGEVCSDNNNNNNKVVLISFLRDFTFWKEGAGRLGLDLEALGRKARFHFLDGLTELYTPPPPHTNDNKNAPDGTPYARPPPESQHVTKLHSPDLTDIEQAITNAITRLQTDTSSPSVPASKITLIIDQPDFLLASTTTTTTTTSPSTLLSSTILSLRTHPHIHSTILTLSADEPLIHAQTTTLEREHAAFVLGMAHEADTVVSLRLLDTGVARDVSGVLQITRGGAERDEKSDEVEEGEWLYHVGGDGGVRVFGRGQ